MASLASRATRAGHLLGNRLRAANAVSPVGGTAAVSLRNYGSEVSSASPEFEPPPGIRAKELAFFAITAVVGAAACYSAWRLAPPSHPVYFEELKRGALDPNAWLELKLLEKEHLNHNTKRYRFSFEDSEAVSGLSVASCIMTRAAVGTKKDGSPNYVIRPYTPVTSPDVKGYFDLVVKTYPQGKMTQHLAKLREGETLEVKGPVPKIPYVPNMKKKIGMIAGGSGITPMFQVIDAILSNSDDNTQVTLLYANSKPEDILLKEKLDEFAQIHPNFKIHYIVSSPTNDWKGGVGHVDFDKIIKGLPAPSPDTLIFVCGPPGMMNAISGDKPSPKDQGELKGLLKHAGYSAEQVFKF